MRYTTIDPNNCKDIYNYIAETFPQVPTAEFAYRLMRTSMLDWDNSIQAVDDNGKMMGFMLFSTATLDMQCGPMAKQQNPELYAKVKEGKQITVWMVGCDRECSRKGLMNAKMLCRLHRIILETINHHLR